MTLINNKVTLRQKQASANGARNAKLIFTLNKAYFLTPLPDIICFFKL